MPSAAACHSRSTRAPRSTSRRATRQHPYPTASSSGLPPRSTHRAPRYQRHRRSAPWPPRRHRCSPTNAMASRHATSLPRGRPDWHMRAEARAGSFRKSPSRDSMSPNWIASTSARASGSSCDNLIPPAEELDTCSPDTAGGSSSVRRSTWREQISRARGPAYPEAHARRSKSSRMPATAVSRFRRRSVRTPGERSRPKSAVRRCVSALRISFAGLPTRFSGLSSPSTRCSSPRPRCASVEVRQRRTRISVDRCARPRCERPVSVSLGEIHRTCARRR